MVLLQRHSAREGQGEAAHHELRKNGPMQYKPTSLYQKGMKILFSYDGVDWKRTGTSITYGRTSIDQNSYSLDFLHDF